MHLNVYQLITLVRIYFHKLQIYLMISLLIAYNDIRGFMTNDYFKKSLNTEPPNSFVS